MIGLLFTLTITYTLADVAPLVAKCIFGQEAFLGFVGEVDITIDSVANNVKAAGKVNNNAGKKWAVNQNHGIQVRSNSDISGGICGNVGDAFDDWGNAQTDADANLVFAFDLDFTGKADKLAKLDGRSLVILRNDSIAVALAQNAIVACCTISSGAAAPVWTAPEVTKAAITVGATAAWGYAWPQGWVAPAGCAYLPPSYVEYMATTTTKATTTTYYEATTITPPPATTKYDPYAPALPPPPPPPPPPAYYYTTTTKATTTTAAQYCWNCPLPDYYGNPPAASAYYYVPCANHACPPNVKCSASQSILAAFAVLAALLALFV